MNIYLKKTVFLLVLIFLTAGCSKNSSGPTNNSVETAPAVIKSITAEKTQILYGGNDPAIIQCNATGGNLKYVWEVDLGDIIPMNINHSKISFNGAACCVGDKTIKCTVSNSLGTDSKTIVITILEVIKTPEIISVESDKAQIANNETANFVCYAIGGHLKYAWEADCGKITYDPADSSKAIYTPEATCLGVKNIKCIVSNEKGTVSKSIPITVLGK